MIKKKLLLLLTTIAVFGAIGTAKLLLGRRASVTTNDANQLADIVKNANEAEAKVFAMLDKASEATKKKDYDLAYKICDEAIAQYGSKEIFSDTYGNFAKMIEAHKEFIRCIQRRTPEKSFASMEELKKEIVEALRVADTERISKLLHCGMGVGVPESAHGFEYHPEKLAIELAALRKNDQTETLIDFEATGHNEFLTEGYFDNLVRKFDFKQDQGSKEWFVGSLVYGLKEDVLTTH